MKPYQQNMRRWIAGWSANPNPTPYHIQMRNGYKALVRLLFHKEPDPHNTKPILARTLFGAYWREHKKVARLLACVHKSEARLLQMVQEKEILQQTLRDAKTAMSLIQQKGHHTGYDWNADPENLTALEGAAFASIDAALKEAAE
jgi:hypothetical protein